MTTLAEARDLVRSRLVVEGDLCFRRRCETIVEWLEIESDDLVLDCGSGYGFTLALLSSICEARFVGLEYERDRIAESREVLPANVAFVQGSAESLPFANESFDSFVCSEVLEHLDNDADAAGELHRTLKPGSTGIVTVPSAQYPLGWDPVNWTLERATGKHIGGSHTLSGIWYGHVRLYTVEEITNLLTCAGFRIVELRQLTHFVPPFNHLLMYGIMKPLLMSGKLPAPLDNAGNRMNQLIGKSTASRGISKAIGGALNQLDRLNDSGRLSARVNSFVSIAVLVQR